MYENYSKTLEELKEKKSQRILMPVKKEGKFICAGGKRYLNLSSNDYLGISTDKKITADFLKTADYSLGSTSSRLLTGNDSVYQKLENLLAKLYSKERALIFNSGWHANTGIMSSLLSKNDAVFCDKLNHASILDGIRLSGAQLFRYKHLDYEKLEDKLERYRDTYENAIIITESLFSMDGDRADLEKLIESKKKYNAVLIVDEAHAFGVYGKNGLGLCEKVKEDIDLIIGTFGKACGSMGAFCTGDGVLIDYLINKSRPLIFSTALPEINIAYSLYVIEKIFREMNGRRKNLFNTADKLRLKIQNAGLETIGDSFIIPVILGKNEKALRVSNLLLENGYYLLPIRHPTVAPDSSRVRISLRADIGFEEVEKISDIMTCI